jgi:restriction system protein
MEITMPKILTVPSPESLMWPSILALRELGGSASHPELLEKVVELESIPEDVQNIMHAPARGWTKLSYNLCLVKIILGKAGVLDVSPTTKGMWVLMERGKTISEAEVGAIPEGLRKARSTGRARMAPIEDALQVEPQWKTEMLEVLKSMPPASFEALAQRLLRQSGFVKVEVTGKSGDGGIDGIGVLRIADLLSFHVYFQCKRYKETVSSGAIRDFRGAIVGRTDKGLFITTGTFTADAKREATRDGVPPIDLVDGDRLCDLLKSLNLGVSTRTVEEVLIDRDWFSRI